MAKQKLALLLFFRQTNLEEFEVGQTEPTPAQPVPTKRLSDRQLLEEIASHLLKIETMIKKGVRTRSREPKARTQKQKIIAGSPPSGPKREVADHAQELKKLLTLDKADMWSVLKNQALEASKAWKKPLGNAPS